MLRMTECILNFQYPLVPTLRVGMPVFDAPRRRHAKDAERPSWMFPCRAWERAAKNK